MGCSTVTFEADGEARSVNSYKASLPITDILVIETVNNVFAHDQIWQVSVRGTAEQIGWNQVGLLNHSSLIAATDRAQHLLAQPAKVRLELRQHGRRCKIPC